MEVCRYKDFLTVWILDASDVEDIANNGFTDTAIGPTAIYAGGTKEGIFKALDTCESYSSFSAPAGVKRGQLPTTENTIDLSMHTISLLYEQGINPVKYIHGKPCVWGELLLHAYDEHNIPIRYLCEWIPYKWAMDTEMTYEKSIRFQDLAAQEVIVVEEGCYRFRSNFVWRPEPRGLCMRSRSSFFIIPDPC